VEKIRSLLLGKLTPCPALLRHVRTYMDPARLQRLTKIRIDGHNC